MMGTGVSTELGIILFRSRGKRNPLKDATEGQIHLGTRLRFLWISLLTNKKIEVLVIYGEHLSDLQPLLLLG